MTAGLAALLSAFALFAGGAALFAASLRMRREPLTDRVALVQPRFTIATASAGREASTLAENLFRLPGGGLVEPETRAIVRLQTKLGVPANRALMFFTGFRIVLAAVLGLLALFGASRLPTSGAGGLLPFVGMAVAAIVGWLAPIIMIRRGIKKRMKIVSSGLPDALELLVVCVEAGLSLEDGLDRVVDELARSQPALTEELALTSADLKILPSRDQALANFAARVDIPTVRSVITTLSQTLRYGTPLAQSLRVVAAEMRSDSLIKLEEQANKLPALLTLPVIVFLMPTIFLIVGGPAALRLIDNFSH
jgi:tight adherence protein C